MILMFSALSPRFQRIPIQRVGWSALTTQAKGKSTTNSVVRDGFDKITTPKKLTTLTIFHLPGHKASESILQHLKDIRINPYPKKSTIPLEFNLEVLERVPTPEEFHDLLAFIPQPSYTAFLAPTETVEPLRLHPTNGRIVHEIATQNPRAMLWPIVVNWEANVAGIRHKAEIKAVLKTLIWERDGKPAPETLPPPPPAAPWVDWD